MKVTDGIFSLYIGILLGTSISWCGKPFIHFVHHFLRSSGSLWFQDSFRLHASLYMSFASSVTGEIMPTGSYIDVKNFRIPFFVVGWSGTWKFTSNVSLTLFHDTPNIFDSEASVLNSCFSKEMSGFVVDVKSPSSFTFECHWCNLNFASPNTLTAVSLTFWTSSIVASPVIRSSTCKLSSISSIYAADSG